MKLLQIRRCTTMFFHNEPRVAKKLQGDVVSGDPSLLPTNSGTVGRLQERPAIHVSRRDLPQLLSRSKSLRQVIIF